MDTQHEELIKIIEQEKEAKVEKRRIYLEKYRKDNKEKIAAYYRDYFKKNGRIRTQTRATRTKVDGDLRRKKKEEIIQWLGGRCQDCKGIFLPNQYDFHHTDISVKEIAPAVLFNRTREKIKRGLEGCILLCANCHRARHTFKG